MKKIKPIIIALLLYTAGNAMAQNTGIIKGTVLDEKNKPVEFAAVALFEDDKQIKSVNTDDKGDFAFKGLVPGIYSIKIINMGYNIAVYNNVEADPAQVAYLDVKLLLNATELKPVEYVIEWEQPKINPTFTTCTFIKADQIDQTVAPKGDIVMLATTFTPAIIPTPDGKDLYMRGSRRGTSAYYVDGFRTMEPPSEPGMSISGMEILTGGIPAEYGDVSGGVVLITTKDYFWEMKRKNIKQKQKEEAEE